MVKTVAVIANPKSKGIRQTVLSVIDFLKRFRIDVMLDKRTAEAIDVKWHSSQELIYDKADFLLVLGGDGTVLSAARLAADNEIPILAIHMGRLGFIAEIETDDIQNVLAAALNEQLPTQRRMRLECCIVNKSGEQVYKGHALNEVTLSKGAIARMIEFDVAVQDEIINRYRADGFIVSTPTGSTGYSLSAGGPIVSPTMEMMILSPICAHTLNNRTLVIPADSVIRINVTDERQDIFVTQDGQAGRRLDSGETLLIRKAPFYTVLYHLPESSFFKHIRSKFNWGISPC